MILEGILLGAGIGTGAWLQHNYHQWKLDQAPQLGEDGRPTVHDIRTRIDHIQDNVPDGPVYGAVDAYATGVQEGMALGLAYSLGEGAVIEVLNQDGDEA